MYLFGKAGGRGRERNRRIPKIQKTDANKQWQIAATLCCYRVQATSYVFFDTILRRAQWGASHYWHLSNKVPCLSWQLNQDLPWLSQFRSFLVLRSRRESPGAGCYWVEGGDPEDIVESQAPRRKEAGPWISPGKTERPGRPTLCEWAGNECVFVHLFIRSFVHSETPNIKLLRATHYSKGFININSFNTQTSIALILQMRERSHKQTE